MKRLLFLAALLASAAAAAQTNVPIADEAGPNWPLLLAVFGGILVVGLVVMGLLGKLRGNKTADAATAAGHEALASALALAHKGADLAVAANESLKRHAETIAAMAQRGADRRGITIAGTANAGSAANAPALAPQPAAAPAAGLAPAPLNATVQTGQAAAPTPNGAAPSASSAATMAVLTGQPIPGATGVMTLKPQIDPVVPTGTANTVTLTATSHVLSLARPDLHEMFPGYCTRVSLQAAAGDAAQARANANMVGMLFLGSEPMFADLGGFKQDGSNWPLAADRFFNARAYMTPEQLAQDAQNQQAWATLDAAIAAQPAAAAPVARAPRDVPIQGS